MHYFLNGCSVLSTPGFGGKQTPINRKHINIFLTALVGQSSQGRTPHPSQFVKKLQIYCRIQEKKGRCLSQGRVPICPREGSRLSRGRLQFVPDTVPPKMFINVCVYCTDPPILVFFCVFFCKKKRGSPEKSKDFAFFFSAEPLKSLEKNGKRTTSKENHITKKARKTKMARIGGSGWFLYQVICGICWI